VGPVQRFLIACPVLAPVPAGHRTEVPDAAEVIPVLQPLLEQGGALTGQDYKLFVRPARRTCQQLRAALRRSIASRTSCWCRCAGARSRIERERASECADGQQSAARARARRRIQTRAIAR
jgi:hypothetical protein